eukprot:TRINITY_DN9106_c0_g1_i4.p1 TRINITY_DN9106_c0_g1~~TRINITY_DN9106_c0_g1_i4.p1  ORF type:complete len:402 (-),score=58.08 TRINITY_DN9106_c0_g1_i4:43-1248(-)
MLKLPHKSPRATLQWPPPKFTKCSCSPPNSKSTLRSQVHSIEFLCNKNFESKSDYAIAVSEHLLSFLDFRAKNFQGAYDHQHKCVAALHRVIKEECPVVWLLPSLFQAIHDCRIYAKKADDILRKTGKNAKNLEEAGRLLLELFRACFSDRSTPINTSKKMASLKIANNLFAIYFNLNKITNCTTLIKSLEHSGNPIISDFPISQQVTYNYNVGKLTLFGGDYRKARQFLQDAFYNCTVKSLKNKRLLLMYLIPVEALLGKMPSPLLLQKYKLPQFLEILSAVKSGDIVGFNMALNKHEDFFISKGLYLVLEKLRLYTYRKLLKKISIIRKDVDNNKILLKAVVLPVLHNIGETDIDLDEIECIVANLIYTGLVKGYISHQYSCLVLSRQSPFPPKSSIKL